MSEQRDENTGTEKALDGSFYAKDGSVWRSPRQRKMPEGGTGISLGFRVCTADECVGPDAAETIARALNAFEEEQA